APPPGGVQNGRRAAAPATRLPTCRPPRAWSPNVKLSALKPLTLALAVTVALAACQKEADAPAPTGSSADATPAVDMSALKTPMVSFSPSDLDATVPICSDLNAHVNGKWLAANPVPSDRTTWGSFELLAERSLEIQRQLVENMAANPDAGGVAGLIGDIWATGMDEAAINAAGIAPIQPALDEIAALSGPEDIAAYLRTSTAEGRMMLFGFGPEADFQSPGMNIAYAVQAGLGLPDRDYYFDDKHAEIRKAYVEHIGNVLVLSGIEEAQAR